MLSQLQGSKRKSHGSVNLRKRFVVSKSIVEKYARIETVKHGLPGHVSDALMPLFKNLFILEEL